MAVARFVNMNVMSKLIGLGAIVTGGVVLDRRHRRADRQASGVGVECPIGEVSVMATNEAIDDVPVTDLSGDLSDVATGSGLSEVDPQPLTVPGEAVDDDAVAAAHNDAREQHEKLAKPGTNLP